MSLSVGIVGLPNVGKSTLFNALLKRQVALAANYPFATIEPNTGIVPVPDPRLATLAEVVHTTVIKPATVEFVDIAGLVKGASQGAGLGNQFLSHIREVDLICQVIRGFSDPDVIREGSIDPQTDREIIETELLLADLATLEKQKAPKGSTSTEEKERWQIVEQFLKAADEGRLIKEVLKNVQNDAERFSAYQKVTNELNLLTAKHIVYVINVDEGEVKNQDQIRTTMAEQLNVQPADIVVISAKIESELASLSDEDQQLYLADLGLTESGLERLAKVAYQRLGLQSFLTAGEKEVRAWTIHHGTKAPQAAGVIHTDFEKHFIRANVASYDDFITHGGWKGVKEIGKLRIEGKDYVMQEGDVVEFMIGK